MSHISAPRGIRGGAAVTPREGFPGGPSGDRRESGGNRDPSALPQRLTAPQPAATPGTSADGAVAKGAPSSPGPLRNTQRKSLLEARGHRVEGCGWGRAGLGGRGRAAVKPSPRVRRILIPRTERQTDGRTDPASPSALLSRLPKGFLPQSCWGAAGGVVTGSRFRGRGAIHTQVLCTGTRRHRHIQVHTSMHPCP